MIDLVFNAFFNAIGYGFFTGILGVVVIFEFLYTIFEEFDIL